MPVNASWHRWIYASIAKHLHAEATAGSIELVVEFLDSRAKPTWKIATTKAEATVSGPDTKEISKGEYLLSTDVAVIVTSHRSANDYNHIDAAGTFANALDKCILVMDYGATGLVLVGELKPDKKQGENVGVQHIKPAIKDTQVHSIIKVRYAGQFTEL